MDEYAAPPAARISSQTSEALLMSRISIFAPSAARRIAAARPSPLAAPETTAIRSVKRLIILAPFLTFLSCFSFLFLFPSSLSCFSSLLLFPGTQTIWLSHKLEDALRPGGDAGY